MAQQTRFQFTQKSIDNLPANVSSAKSTEAEYTDIQVPGLKLLVGKTGTKKFLLRYTFLGQKKAIALGGYGALNVADARQLANKFKSDIARGFDPKQQREKAKNELVFEEFVTAHYLPHARVNKRSVSTDESKLKNHLLAAFGNKRLSHITLTSVQVFLNKLNETRAPGTCNRHLSLLHRIFALATLWGFVSNNPVTGISKFKENNQRQRFLSHAEIRNLFRAADQDENYFAANYTKFLLLTGARRSEGLAAQWEHISLSTTHPSWFIPETKSGRSRYVLLNPMTVDLLRQLHRVPGHPFLFPGRIDKEPLKNPIKAFKRIAKRAGIEASFRLHDLRHTTASLIVNGGGSLYDVQSTLGHSSSRMSQRYAHLSHDRRQQTSSRISEGIAEALEYQGN